MPELPEVETVRRGLAPAMEGARVVRLDLARDGLRFAFPERFAARVEGRRIAALGRRGKYLLVRFDGGPVAISHLGMSGSWRIAAEGDPGGSADARPGRFHRERGADPAHDHVTFHLRGARGSARAIYNDPRRFGFMLLADPGSLDDHPMLRGLGPEPLGKAFGVGHLARRLAGRSAPLKTALLDQKTVAGLGNIYVCEALWRARLSPARPAGSLVTNGGAPSRRLRRLPDAVREVLTEAIAAGGSSLRDHRRADGAFGYFQHAFRVYDRAGASCSRDGCRGTVQRIVQSGRATFHCPACQR